MSSVSGKQASKIQEIALDQIDDFPDHPFQVRLDEDMEQLVRSIKERGLINSGHHKAKEDGRYEIVLATEGKGVRDRRVRDH